MAQDQSNALVLQLLLKDLADLEDRQKGKQVAGRHTDLEIAMMCLKEDILAIQTSIEDRTLALSTGIAIATDQNLLESIRCDERVAEQDRRYALALSSKEPTPHDIPTISEMGSAEENEDAVSIAMGDLMSRMTLSKKYTAGEGSSRSIIPSCMANLQKECVSCLDKCETIMFTGSCGHNFCSDCTRRMFLGAIKDEELYPPRCCGEVVPPGVALRILNYEELRAFSERAIEWTTKDRLYCAEPTCSKFIPQFAIQDELGTCPNCHRQTHLTCRYLAHPDVDCPMDNALHGVLEMADAENWKRCFNCRTMVELQHGCNHITCRCGREFCYICAQVWKTCNCPLWHENRLVAMAHRAVEEEVPQNANIVERRNAFNRIVEGLRQHEDVGCEHHRNSQWAWRDRGSLQCEVCNHDLPEYIFMCKNCRMRACYRCRRHRMR
ncbi:hypothetical protein BDW59DRAFT_78043 [Aspergillus cavernicola]|uniref:RBR-type E3 ubiquitin transferase n=1 Tax=Aspergillus cavernicola TaxID=176166 RepID=A0ABR4IZY3_9EURO